MSQVNSTMARTVIGAVAIVLSFCELALPDQYSKLVAIAVGGALALDQFIGNGNLQSALAPAKVPA